MLLWGNFGNICVRLFFVRVITAQISHKIYFVIGWKIYLANGIVTG